MVNKAVVTLDGGDVSVDLIDALTKWIRLSPKFNNCIVQEVPVCIKTETMGVDPVVILEIILGSKVFIELVKCIQEWIKVTAPKVSVSIKNNGDEYKIELNGSIAKKIIRK